LAAELKKTFGIDTTLIRGKGGIFNVIVQNQKIFSKHDEGRFPTENEILDKVRNLQKASS